MRENADASSGGALNSSVQQSGTASPSTNGSEYSGQNDTGEDSAANTQSDAGIDAEQYADNERSIAAPEPIAEESVQTQVQTRPVLTLPQSLHGAHTAYCYVAVGGSSLPDIDGELLARGERRFVVPAGQQYGNARKDFADSRTGRLHGDCL